MVDPSIPMVSFEVVRQRWCPMQPNKSSTMKCGVGRRGFLVTAGAGAAGLTLAPSAVAGPAEVTPRGTDIDLGRTDFFVRSTPSVEIFVREVRPRRHARARTPVLLIHGARVPGVASFDLDVAGGSLAGDLADAGHPAYILDVRGYGASTRPDEMSRPPEAHPPLVRSPEAVADIGAVVDFVCRRRRLPSVALLGWATGGQWAAYYATLHPERVSHLLLYNALYGGGVDRHPSIGHGSNLEDPERPGVFNPSVPAYRYSTAEDLLPSWDEGIPVEDKSQWRDPEVLAAYQAAALASDPTSQHRDPPSFRAPSGALEDSFYLATGRQLFEGSLLRSPTLAIRSNLDFWSRAEDVVRLQQHAVRAPRFETLAIAGATHYVHLDRPHRGRDRLFEGVLGFLAGS